MAIPVDMILKTAATLPGPELEHLVAQLIQIRSARLGTVSEDEGALLMKISKPFPDDLSRRYEALLRKKEHGLTEAERQTLLDLNDQIELLDAEKIGNMKRLAEIRGVGLDDVMRDLGIKPRDYA